MNLRDKVWIEYLGGLQTLQTERSLQVLAEVIYYSNVHKGKNKVISIMSSRRIKNLFWLEVGKMTHHDPAFFMVADFVYKMSVFSDEEIDTKLARLYPEKKFQQNFKKLISLYKKVQVDQTWVNQSVEEISRHIQQILEWLSIQPNKKHFSHSSGKLHSSPLTNAWINNK